MDDEIRVIVKTELAEAIRDIEKFANKTKDSMNDVSKETNKFTKLLANLGTAVAGFEAISGAVEYLKEAWLDAAKAQKELVLLNESFSQTGMGAAAAREATDAFKRFAEEQQKVTVYSDSTILSAGRYMEALSGLTEQGLEKATKAAMGFASATGGELQSVLEQLSESSEGGKNAFKKYGIEVSETGTKAQKLEQIVSQLNKRFGDFAEREGQTVVGQMAIMKNSMASLQQQIGEFLAFNVATANGSKGMFASIIEYATNAVDAIEFGLVAAGTGISNFITGLVYMANAGASAYDLIKAKVFGTEEEANAAFDKMGDAYETMTSNMVTVADAWQNHREEKEKQFSALYAKENKSRASGSKQLTQKQIEDAKKLAEDRSKATNDSMMVFSGSLNKELLALKNNYDEKLKLFGIFKKKISMSPEEQAELAKDAYEKEREDIITKSFASYVDDRQAKIDLENQMYDELLENFKGTERQKEAAARQHAKNIEAINRKMTEEEQQAFDATLQIVGQIGSAIGGEVGQVISGVSSMIASLASGNVAGAIAAAVGTAIELIQSEAEKAKKAVEQLKELSLQYLTDVQARRAQMETAALEQEKARRIAEMDKETAYMMARYSLTAENYSNMNAVTKAYYDQQQATAAASYAAMTVDEQNAYNVKMAYEKQKQEAQDKADAAKAVATAEMDAKIKESKRKEFEANKGIELAKLKIDREKALSEVIKNFPMPWDDWQRRKLMGEIRTNYGELEGLMNSQVFPEYAKGTNNAARGWSVVGERGPELRWNNGGETIVPNNHISNVMQNMGQTMTINGGITLNGVQDVQGLAKALENVANGMGKSIFK